VIIPVLRPRLAIGHVRRGDMANPVKGAIGQLGERVIDTSKGLFTALRDAFSRESAGNIQELQSVIKSFPSIQNPTIDNAPLMAAHNTSVEGIIAANEIGGIPSPSIGISDPSNLGQFGEISLIMDPNKLDPRMNIYPTDAYTGRQPKGEVLDSGKRVLPPRDPYYEDGSRKPNRPYTMNTVLKDMRQGPYGPMYLPASEEYAQNSSGALRAATSRPFKSIDEIKNSRGKIYVEGRDNVNLEKDPLDAFHSQFSRAKFSLINDLQDKFQKTEIRTRRSKNEDGEFVTTQEPITRQMGMDTANELLLALGRNDADINKTAAVSEGFVSMDDIPALKDAVNRLGEVLENAPTKYFEAKPNAAMSLSDFDVALVPADVAENEEVMRILRENNLPVSTYTDFGPNKDDYREGVMRQMKENLFSIGGTGMLGYGALQSVGEDDGESGS